MPLKNLRSTAPHLYFMTTQQKFGGILLHKQLNQKFAALKIKLVTGRPEIKQIDIAIMTQPLKSTLNRYIPRQKQRE